MELIEKTKTLLQAGDDACRLKNRMWISEQNWCREVPSGQTGVVRLHQDISN